MKKVAFITMSMLSVASIVLPAVSAQAYLHDESYNLSSFTQQNENFSSIQETLTSAIDGTSFVAHFNPETGRVSSFDMNGESKGYRYIDNEEAFWELVAINTEVTSQSIERYMEAGRASHNISSIDVESKMLVEFDEHGTKIEPYINSRIFTEGHILPRFDTSRISMFVPFANMPTPSDGRSSFVGGGLFNTNSSHNSVELWTYNFPSNMRTIDVHLTNAWGDDFSTHLDILPWREVSHNIRFRGEPYGATVSSWYGGFPNVDLRFFARGGSGSSGPQHDPDRHNPRWFHSSTVPLRSFSFSSPWHTAANNGISNWNSRSTPVTFVTNSTSNNFVRADSHAQTWYGRIRYLEHSGSSLTRFEIDLNTRSISISPTLTNLTNFATSVMAHELGHAIGLPDNPVGTATNGSIMNHARNRNSITVPTNFDVTSVNMLYN